jgi:hypothetical protein
MMKKIMLLLLIALSSCSTKKNTAIIAESSTTALTQKEREFLINTLNASFENNLLHPNYKRRFEKSLLETSINRNYRFVSNFNLDVSTFRKECRTNGE